MHRRFMILATAAIVPAFALQALADGPGLFRSRGNSRGTTTRTYRSYSVNPGETVVAEPSGAAESSEAAVRPAPAPSRPARRSSSSKPSYMRADSKAQGRFGQ